MVMWMLKGAVVLAGTLLLSWMARDRPARLRRAVLATGMVGTLLLPLLPGVLPVWSRPTAVAGAIPGEVALRGPADVVVEAAPALGAAPVVTAPSTRASASEVAFAVWLLGAVLLLGRLGRQHAAAAGLRSRCATDIPSAWRHEARALAVTLGIDREVCVRVTDEVDTPMALGLRRPTVVLPSAARDWPAGQVRASLAHELAHVAGQDTRLAFASAVLSALRWPDPFVWWAARRLRDACEHAADDAALSSGGRPSEYAAMLLSFAGRPRSTVAAIGASGAPLARRIDAVLAARVRRASPAQMASAFSAAAALVVTVGCAGPEVGEVDRAGASATERAASVQVAGEDDGIRSKVDQALRRWAREVDPVTASVVVLEAKTGLVLATSGLGPAGADAALTSVEPASTAKPLTIAAAIEAGLDPGRTFDTGDGELTLEGGTIRDYRAHGEIDVTGVVALSSNVGAAQIAGAVDAGALRAILRGLGMGVADLEEWSPLRRGLMASGIGYTATPVQVAAAYGALATGGVYHPPALSPAEASAGRRVLSAETATGVRAMLEAAVERGTGRRARVDGLRLGGKTGTLEIDGPDGQPMRRASFVGLVPVDDPRWVVHVQVDSRDPNATGGRLAAPLFGRLARQLSATP